MQDVARAIALAINMAVSMFEYRDAGIGTAADDVRQRRLWLRHLSSGGIAA
jgi:hypothetical protein